MKSVKKNFALTSIYQVLYVLTPLVTTPYVSRVLGANNIGDFSFAFSVAEYFTFFIRLGVLNYGNRSVASERDDKTQLSKIFCEIYALQLFCGALFTIIYVLWIFFFSPRADLSLCLLFFVISSVLDITWLLYGVEDFYATTIRDIFVRLAIVIGTFAFVKGSEDIWIYTLIQSLGYFVGQGLAWLRVKKHVYYYKPSVRSIFKHLRPDLILFIPTIAVSLYKTMDKIMLGIMSSSVELGYYESSERVIKLPMAFIIALATVMFPRMSNLVSNNISIKQMNAIIEKTIVFTSFISTLLCFGMMSVANLFVPIFYGKGYSKCIILYKWLLPSCVFLAFANVLRTEYLLPKKKDKQYIVSLFVGASVNLLINCVAIVHYQSVGAAAATLVAEACVCIIQMLYSRHELNICRMIIKTIPFVVSGVTMFLFLSETVILAGSKFVSLVLKVILCSGLYFFTLGIILLSKRLIKVKILKHS